MLSSVILHLANHPTKGAYPSSEGAFIRTCRGRPSFVACPLSHVPEKEQEIQPSLHSCGIALNSAYALGHNRATR